MARLGSLGWQLTPSKTEKGKRRWIADPQFRNWRSPFSPKSADDDFWQG